MENTNSNAKTYVLSLTNGHQFRFVMEDFSPAQFAHTINNERVTVITVGDIVFNRQMFGTLVPADIVPTAVQPQ